MNRDIGLRSQDVTGTDLSVLVEDALDRKSWQPRPPLLRKLQRESGERSRQLSSRRGMWIAVGVYLAFTATDYLLLPDVAWELFLARLSIVVVVLAMLEAQFRIRPTADRIDGICAFGLVAAHAGWLAVGLTSEFTQSMTYYVVFGAIFMMSANLFFCFSFAVSAAASGTILLSFLAAMVAFMPADLSYRLAFGGFFLACFGFTTYVNWRLNNERYRVFLNSLKAKLKQDEATERGNELLFLSKTDPLTGLSNRRAIDEMLRQYWNDWETTGCSFATILIDIDFFKLFNDCHGHQQGDHCLIIVASRLRELVEELGGSIGRFGGEEFIVLIQLRNEKHLSIVAETIRRSVEELALAHDQRRDGETVVTVSVGASYTRAGLTPRLERLVNQADRALYSAKSSGRNCVTVFDPAKSGIREETEHVAALLRTAIEKNMVSLVYQPIKSPVSNQVEAAESLMRLEMLDGTVIPPSVFIPIAERTGAIYELGRWAIRTACLELLVDRHAPLVSVNVSALQLRNPGFAGTVATILADACVVPNRLALEITEGMEIALDSDVLHCLSDLKQLGVKIWLDDFGTGFAGLSWLRVVDFDTIKIDKSFLRDTETERGVCMFDDMITLIRNRGHRIIVEGVETEEQFEMLRRKGIDRAQGYYVGRPAPVAQYVQRECNGLNGEPVALQDSFTV